jgi:cell division protein YceG involved in septum cleavage
LTPSFIYPTGFVIFSSAGHYIGYIIVIYILTLPALAYIFGLQIHKKQVSSPHGDKRKTRVGTSTTKAVDWCEEAKWIDSTEEMQAICRPEHAGQDIKAGHKLVLMTSLRTTL